MKRYDRLTKKEMKNDEVIKINGISIDNYSRRVYVNGKEVYLASKEFDILQLLARNPNRVFSKEEIFERIWGIDSVGNGISI